MELPNKVILLLLAALLVCVPDHVCSRTLTEEKAATVATAGQADRTAQEAGTSGTSEDEPRKRKILVLHTLKAKRPWNVLFNRYFTEALQESGLSLANLDIENLDLLQFKDADYRKIVRRQLEYKYADAAPDVIIITFASTIDFVLENDLFPGISKILVLPTPSGLDKVPGSVVLPFAFEFRNNIEHALALLPETRSIYVVAGNGLMDKRLVSMLRNDTEDLENRVSFHYLDDLSVEDLLGRIERLPDDSFVYYLTYSLDFQGKAVITRDFSQRIGDHSNRPVFSWLDLHVLNVDILGGRVTTTRASATMSLDVVKRVFEGESIDSIEPPPPYVEYIYQWEELKKWGIDPGKLPPESVIQNRTYSFFEVFKWRVTGGIVLVALEALLILFLLINIRRRKTAEQELRGYQHKLEEKVRALEESEERYELAVAGSASGIWDWDIPSGKVYYSGRFKELLGYEAEEPWEATDDFWNRVHPDDTQTVRAAIERHLEERVAYRIDFRLQIGSREYRWFYARGQALWDSAGKPLRMAGSITDVTQRREAEKGLLESEQRFRSLMEQSPLAIVLLTPEGKISQVNSAWKKLWGVDDDETADIIKKYNLLDDDQYRNLGLADLIKKGLAGENVVLPPLEYRGQQTVEDFNFEGIKTKTAWIQLHLNPVSNEKNEIDCIVITIVDLTALKRSEEESLRQREILARMSRVARMEQLTGSIAHELNQPLTGILSNAQAGEMAIGRGECDHDEISTIMGEIAADAKRAGEVIRSLRELYREQKIEPKPFDINALIEETEQLLHSEIVMWQVEFTVKCAPSPPAVSGNTVQIQQVLVNLIVNAGEAMRDTTKDGRRLHVATAYDANEVKVWVEDCGPGIDEDKIETIFEPLVTWKPGGTGMGLAISNSIIQAHGGRMWAENRPGGGARVGFVLPALKEERPA